MDGIKRQLDHSVICFWTASPSSGGQPSRSHLLDFTLLSALARVSWAPPSPCARRGGRAGKAPEILSCGLKLLCVTVTGSPKCQLAEMTNIEKSQMRNRERKYNVTNLQDFNRQKKEEEKMKSRKPYCRHHTRVSFTQLGALFPDGSVYLRSEPLPPPLPLSLSRSLPPTSTTSLLLGVCVALVAVGGSMCTEWRRSDCKSDSTPSFVF